MILSPQTLRRFVVSALFLAPAVISAQAPMSTGTSPVGSTDPFWDVSVNGGSFYDAFVLSRGGGTATSNWIGADPSGSLEGGAADGNFNRFLYSYQTMFTGTSGMTLTFRCARDDAFFSVLLNGETVAGATCGGYDLGSAFTINSGFADGSNTLQFNTGGNGITDGLIVDITDVTNGTTTTPEPSTIVLVASGLACLVFAGRGRLLS
jgi:hypothetical protein